MAIVRENGRMQGVIVGCDERTHSGVLVDVLAECVGGDGRSVVEGGLSGVFRIEPHRVRVITDDLDLDEFLLDIECPHD